MDNKTGKTEQEVMNDKAKRIMQGINVWTSFYRANPHRFCADYLNIHLKPFQQILIIMMNICYYVMYIAARGQLAAVIRNDSRHVGKIGGSLTANTEVSL